jgi:hypothetical protein
MAILGCHDQPVGNGRKMVKAVLLQDALDKIVDAIADDGDWNTMGFTEIDEGRKVRVDVDVKESSSSS